MAVSEKILIVEDESEIADLIELYLLGENFEVRKCQTAREAFTLIADATFDLAVLDVMLPDADGFAICRRIREAHAYPVVMLTARDGESDKITGLTIGADDYVTKPFRPLELVARIKAQLRRYKRYNGAVSPANPDMLICGDITLDAEARACTLRGAPLALTPTEFTILRALLARHGTAVSAEQLFRAVWGDAYYDKNSNTITVHIRHLREKLGDAAGAIKTVWGYGYKCER
jgi:two-component system response regulator VanR